MNDTADTVTKCKIKKLGTCCSGREQNPPDPTSIALLPPKYPPSSIGRTINRAAWLGKGHFWHLMHPMQKNGMLQRKHVLVIRSTYPGYKIVARTHSIGANQEIRSVRASYKGCILEDLEGSSPIKFNIVQHSSAHGF